MTRHRARRKGHENPAPADKDLTAFERILKRLKNHKILAWILAGGVAVTGIAQVAGAFKALIDLARPSAPSDRKYVLIGSLVDEGDDSRVLLTTGFDGLERQVRGREMYKSQVLRLKGYRPGMYRISVRVDALSLGQPFSWKQFDGEISLSQSDYYVFDPQTSPVKETTAPTQTTLVYGNRQFRIEFKTAGSGEAETFARRTNAEIPSCSDAKPGASWH